MINKCYKTICLWICILLFVSPAGADNDKPSEYLVKATFLYHFAKFVEWDPGIFENPDSPVMLCILGDDPFGDALKSIENKKIGERSLLIRMCKNTNEITGCNILFISSSEEGNLMKILSDIKGESYLTVSDMDEFTQQGGMIKFFNMDNKIRFEINHDAANRSQIKISSKLLNISKIFRE